MIHRSLVILLALYGILVADQVAASTPTTSASESQVVVYYFHRTSRCHSCLTIEANIDDALKAHFPDALDDGSLLWLPTNTEEPENAHFEEDFSLEFSSAVLVRLDGKKVVSWTNLEKVWDLLENKEEFLVFIQQAVGAALAGESKEQDTQKQR